MLNFRVFLLFCTSLAIGFTLFGCSPSSNNIDELNLRIAELERENAAIKEHCSETYRLRNELDIKARKIYKALETQDIDTLKEEVSKNTKVLSDSILFDNEYGKYHFKFSPSDKLPVLRQRWYELSPDQETFSTGYEILWEDTEYMPVISFTFSKEEGEWKLVFITTE